MRKVRTRRIRPCIRNNKADLRYLKKVAKKRAREWRGRDREEKKE